MYLERAQQSGEIYTASIFRAVIPRFPLQFTLRYRVIQASGELNLVLKMEVIHASEALGPLLTTSHCNTEDRSLCKIYSLLKCDAM
jgi:hypothetical protein